jgi:hypothetical protein
MIIIEIFLYTSSPNVAINYSKNKKIGRKIKKKKKMINYSVEELDIF